MSRQLGQLGQFPPEVRLQERVTRKSSGHRSPRPGSGRSRVKGQSEMGDPGSLPRVLQAAQLCQGANGEDKVGWWEWSPGGSVSGDPRKLGCDSPLSPSTVLCSPAGGAGTARPASPNGLQLLSSRSPQLPPGSQSPPWAVTTSPGVPALLGSQLLLAWLGVFSRAAGGFGPRWSDCPPCPHQCGLAAPGPRPGFLSTSLGSLRCDPPLWGPSLWPGGGRHIWKWGPGLPDTLRNWGQRSHQDMI